MSVDEIVARQTIEFPYPVSLRIFEDVLGHLSRSLPASISYEVKVNKRISPGRHPEETPEIERGSVSGSGVISSSHF